MKNRDKAQLTEVDKKINTISEHHALGPIKEELYNQFMPEYATERANIREKLTELEEECSNPQENIDTYVEVAAKIPEIWEKFDFRKNESTSQFILKL